MRKIMTAAVLAGSAIMLTACGRDVLYDVTPLGDGTQEVPECVAIKFDTYNGGQFDLGSDNNGTNIYCLKEDN